jgi:zinc transporter, ZIP family
VYVALAWGFIAAASLIIGGLLALHLTISRRTLGYIMAFGGGVLISAIAYELVEEAVATAAGGPVALGVFAGAITFFGGDLLIDRLGGSDRKASSGAQAEGNTLPIVLGTVLDGVPESIVLGVSLLSGKISIAMLSGYDPT